MHASVLRQGHPAVLERAQKTDRLTPVQSESSHRAERHKPVDPGTVFYNPMRILLGSIGMVDADDAMGITSLDNVVVRSIEGKLHYRRFYWWLRSWCGAELVKSLTRGAVRERMLFRSLASGSVRLPPWEAQVAAAETTLRIGQARRQVTAQLPSIGALPAAYLRCAFDAASRPDRGRPDPA